MKKKYLLPLLLLVSFSIFSQAKNLNEKLEDFDFKGNINTVFQELTNYYNVFHGTVESKKEKPVKGYIEAKFHENGQIDYQNRYNDENNKNIKKYIYDENWNCIDDGFNKAKYDDKNRIVYHSYAFVEYEYIYERTNKVTIISRQNVTKKVRDKQEYFYSDGDEILYYKYDIDDGLDAYFTRTYDKNRNLLTYNRYSKYSLNNISKFYLDYSETNTYDNSGLVYKSVIKDDLIGKTKVNNFYKNNKIIKSENYKPIKNGYELDFVINYTHEEDLTTEKHHNSESELLKTIYIKYADNEVINYKIIDENNIVISETISTFDENNNILTKVFLKNYNDELVKVEERKWTYEYYN